MALKFKYYLCTPFSEKPTANYCETFNETFNACKFSMEKVFENCQLHILKMRWINKWTERWLDMTKQE